MEIRDARFVASAVDVSRLPPPAFVELAFAGRSNVGKSSLINALVQRKKLVRTSGTPGCTRGVNIFRVQLCDPDAVLDLVDLPGYGYAKRSRSERRAWAGLVETFLKTRPGLRGVVLIIDVRRGFEDEDRRLLDFLREARLVPIVAATKMDKISISRRKPRLRELGRGVAHRVHGFSATRRLGCAELWKTLLATASISAPGDAPEPPSAP